MAAKAEAPTIDYEPEHIILGENTLKANYLPTLPYKFDVYGAFSGVDDIDIVLDVITCESGWNQNAKGLAGEIGIAQFKLETWNKFNEIRGTNLNIYSGADQLDMIIWAFKNGLQGHWTCYEKVLSQMR